MRRWKVRHFTKLKRLAGCGRWLNGTANGEVIIRKTGDGVSHYSGLQSCGSVWSCPACAAKIRQERADELEAGIAAWIAQGGGVEFVTLTVPHRMGDELRPTFSLVLDGWRKGLLGGRWGQEWRRAMGVSHWVRTVEVTHGAHGWHPHIHALLFTAQPWTGRQRATRGQALFDRWAGWVARAGGGRCSRAAFRIEGGQAGAGAYLTKLQDSHRRVGMELTRQDLKHGRRGSETPFELIERAHNGEADALALWWEWEQASSGRRCLTWSRGGHAAIVGTVERTDQEIAEAEVGGDVVEVIPGALWALVAAVPGADAALLSASERGDAGQFLADLRAGP